MYYKRKAMLDALQQKLDIRIPGNEFDAGYSDHAITSAAWSLPDQKEDLQKCSQIAAKPPWPRA